MPFPATVFHVLIASPSDVPAEREAIAVSLNEWNALNSQETGNVLLPVMWESHSAPAMHDRPQGIINDQVVRSCDILIGAFWTRLGSPTGSEDSGTVEEIKWFLKHNKPVMLYYSKMSVDIETIDTVQLEKLKEFKNSIRNKGLQEQYNSLDELKQKLSRQLTIIIRGMSVGTVVNQRVVREAKESAQESTIIDYQSKSDAPKIQEQDDADKIRLEEYSDRSFVVLGNTLAIKETMKELGGKYISLRTGGKGWNFSKRKLNLVAQAVKLPALLSPTQ